MNGEKIHLHTHAAFGCVYLLNIINATFVSHWNTDWLCIMNLWVNNYDIQI